MALNVNSNIYLDYISKALEFKLIFIKQKIPNIIMNDLINYLLNIKIKKYSKIEFVSLINFINKISSNKLVEYLNNCLISEANINLENFKNLI